MGKLLEASVAEQRDGTWWFRCPGVRGSLCGDLATGTPFLSAGWPTKKAALARGQQHFDEHKGIAPMQELEEFRRDQGLSVAADGSVTVEDL
jgi:hypothetical protein